MVRLGLSAGEFPWAVRVWETLDQTTGVCRVLRRPLVARLNQRHHWIYREWLLLFPRASQNFLSPTTPITLHISTRKMGPSYSSSEGSAQSFKTASEGDWSPPNGDRRANEGDDNAPETPRPTGSSPSNESTPRPIEVVATAR